MRQWLPLVVVLSLVPVGATAQTSGLPPAFYVVGNTVVAATPMALLASGKGPAPSRGAGAPSPSTSPAPASAQSFGDPGRAESSFSFPQPIRVQVEGLTTTQAIDLPPFTIQAVPGGAATLTIPVQVLFRSQGTPPSQGTLPSPGCPGGCVTPEPVPPPTSQPMPQPALRQRVCNVYGQCIPWP